LKRRYLCGLDDKNETPVAFLYRVGVHGVELAEASDVGLVHRNWVGKHDPIDCLTHGGVVRDPSQ
jgi:hypothetical protein